MFQNEASLRSSTGGGMVSTLIRVESWPDYVKRVIGDSNATQQQIEERTGIPSSTVGRWLRGERVQPKAETVVAFARAFYRPPVEALIAAGYITAAEGEPERRHKTPLTEYATAELFDELRSRMGAD